MNIGRICRSAARSLVRLTVVAVLVQSSLAATEEKFTVFHTKTKSYTNVTVTSKSKGYVLIMHASGTGSVPVSDLTPELSDKLGYGAALAKAPKTNSLSASINRITSGLHLPQVKVIGQAWQNTVPAVIERYHLSSSDVYTILAILFGVYLVACYCLGTICRKAHSEPGFMVWVPVFQVFPMLRAAKMSRWWFFLFCTPACVLAHIAWCINIVKARDKSPWVALLLLLPVTGLFAFLYLAFSSSKPVFDAPRYKSMALQVA